MNENALITIRRRYGPMRPGDRPVEIEMIFYPFDDAQSLIGVGDTFEEARSDAETLLVACLNRVSALRQKLSEL